MAKRSQKRPVKDFTPQDKGGETYDPHEKGGGDAGESESSAVPQDPGATPAQEGGPRIVINPSTFRNEKDALCVAFNEAFRVIMETNGFEPRAEPTPAQRRFFADTAYADDEVQLRRTILARICTFDTSVKDPTQEQLEEAVEFLQSVLDGGYCKNEWEQNCVQRILTVVSKAVEQGGQEAEGPEAEGPEAEGPDPMNRSPQEQAL